MRGSDREDSRRLLFWNTLPCASARGAETCKAYCDAMEEQLSALYTSVEGDFSTFYRDANSDDEGSFKARLEVDPGIRTAC